MENLDNKKNTTNTNTSKSKKRTNKNKQNKTNSTKTSTKDVVNNVVDKVGDAIKSVDFKLELRKKDNTILYLTTELENAARNLENQIKETVEKEQLLKFVTEESIPKEKLRNENFFERFNWWYRDLQGWQKVFAHISMVAILAILVFGVYSGTINATTGDQLISTAITIILGLFGINLQASLLKEPTKENNLPTEEIINN